MSDLEYLEEIRIDIQKQIDDLWQMQEVLGSLKVIINYFKTGKTHPEYESI